MKRIDVFPLKGFEGIEFGMDRQTVRRALGRPVKFRKTASAENTTDDFGFCHVFYDGDNRVEAAEFFNEAEIYFGGVKIAPLPLPEMLRRIPLLERDEDGAVSIPLSIGVYAPDGEFESILFAKSGYFDLAERKEQKATQ